jgi:hypothetical protein
MADVMDLPTKVVSFQDEVRQCLQLAKAEPDGESWPGWRWGGSSWPEPRPGLTSVSVTLRNVEAVGPPMQRSDGLRAGKSLLDSFE